MLIAVLMAFVRSHPTRFAWDTLVRFGDGQRAPRARCDLAKAELRFGGYTRCMDRSAQPSDGVFWFGSAAMLQAWIAFDCLMVGVLLALGYGPGIAPAFCVG